MNKALVNFGQEKKTTFIDDLAGEIPILKSCISAIELFQYERQKKAMMHFFNHSEIDDQYLLSLENNEGEKEVLYDYIKTVLSTYSSIACIALALAFKDKTISFYRQKKIAASLINIDTEVENFLLDLRVKNFYEDSSNKNNALNTLDYFDDAQDAHNIANDVITRGIATRGIILDDMGTYIILTEYTSQIIGLLEQAREIDEKR